MSHKNRGHAIIFNQEFFEIKGIEPRPGTNIDCKKLLQTLTNLHFDVSIYKDYGTDEILSVIEKLSNNDHSENDCIVFVILSHGQRNVFFSKDGGIAFESLYAFFTANRCPTLAGKPKLFFIQACQGDKVDSGVTMVNRTQTDGVSTMSYKIPIQADFLIACSTIPGYVSWRNETTGTSFIQNLCEQLNTNGKLLDIMTLLTIVNRNVAIDFESVSDDPSYDGLKQMPCITYMLTRILKFNDK